MILFHKTWQWTPADTKTDVSFSFTCPEHTEALCLTFSFSPDALREEQACLPPIEHALEQYYDGRDRNREPMEASGFLPLKNLITLSLSREGVYMGNAHRWQASQVHVLTKEKADPGFTVPERLEGDWEGMLHLHAICTSACGGELTVEAVPEGRESHALVSR